LLFQCVPCSLDFRKNLLPFLLPDIALWRQVAFCQISFNGAGQLLHMSEAAFSDHILGQVPEEPLHQIKPRATGGREVDYQPVASVLPAVLSISPLEPTAHLWRLVRSVVVHDEMQRQLGG